jgi:hypothetical protein
MNCEASQQSNFIHPWGEKLLRAIAFIDQSKQRDQWFLLRILG